MLDLDDRAELDRWILSMDCQVTLPNEFMSEKFARSLSMPDDRRRFARAVCRGLQYRAALKYADTFPALQRPSGWRGVYMLDVSRGGCGFLHSEPLFPGERMEILFLGGARHGIEIVRCARWNDHCFAIGSRFVETASADDRAACANSESRGRAYMNRPEVGEEC